MVRTRSPQWLLAATSLAYLLIAIEIIIMTSPFALYFYGVYGSILNFLVSFPLTRWTAEFFLPDMVFLDDPLILFISYLQVLLVIGLVLFLSAAIPLYWGSFTKKGVVYISFYAKIRHPQYLFLAISSFGLMLFGCGSPRWVGLLTVYLVTLAGAMLLARGAGRIRSTIFILFIRKGLPRCPSFPDQQKREGNWIVRRVFLKK